MRGIARTVYIVAWAVGGVYGSFRLLSMFVAKIGSNPDLLRASGEGALVLIPVCLIGAAISAAVGGLFLPRQR